MPEVERQKFCRTQSQQNVHKEASDKCSFAKISVNNKDWCNGRSEQGKDALACVPKGFARTQSQLSTHRPSPYEKWER